MLKIEGIWWPDDVEESWKHALRHVRSLDYAISICKQRRTAVQAGGNVGLWPMQMAKKFARVVTFEPEPVSMECLMANIAALSNVEPVFAAVGDRQGDMHIVRGGLGSHRLMEAPAEPVCRITTIDSLNLQDVDLLQLDVEGYEWHAMTGAMETVKRCHPVIQLEYRNFTQKYGKTDDMIDKMLKDEGYKLVSRQPGSDVVYA